MEKKKKFSISLTTQILVATIGGLVFGVIVGPWASNIKFIGDIFLRLIQMSVVLLVMSAVAGAVGGGDGRDVGKMGFHTFKWIIGFTIFSAALGVVLAMLVKPGIGIDLSSAEEVAEATVGSASLQETLTNFVPTNVIQAMAEGSMVPCIVFALFFGVAMGQYTKNTKNRNVASSLGLPMDSIAVLIGIDWFAGMFRTLMNVDVDVMVAMLVACKIGEFDYDVYNEKKTVKY